jgi:hypothetical protein
MAKKKPVGKSKSKGTVASPKPTVTTFMPVFKIGTAVDFKVQGSNFFGTVTVAVTENANTAITWTVPTSSVVPDDEGNLTIVAAMPKVATKSKVVTSGAGEGDLTISVTSQDGLSTGETTQVVAYTP